MPRPKKTNDSPSTKSTDFEVQKRINVVYKMLLLGISRADIVEYAEKEYRISHSMTDEYIARANAIFKQQAEYIREDEYGKALSRLQNLYEKNMKIQDYKAALATQKELSELLGLYPAKKLNVANADGKAFEITFVHPEKPKNATD